jgi:hypothetical protein
MERAHSVEAVWDELLLDSQFIFEVVHSFRSNNQPLFSFHLFRNHLKELLPPIKTGSVIIDLARLCLQDVWFDRYIYEELARALESESDMMASPEARVLSDIRTMFENKNLILSGEIKRSELMSSISAQIASFNSQQIAYFTEAATFGLFICIQTIEYNF